MDVSKLHPAGLENYRNCTQGATSDGTVIEDGGVECREHSWREAAVGRCGCGLDVTLSGFTNTCDCGRDYNSAGQMLAPREQWGEDTGETVGEILMIG